MMELDQEKLLDEACLVVREQARYMKRSLESDNLRDGLKYASNMICELRTSLLSPKNYYELYMLVFQELQHLNSFFSDKSRHGRKMSELYESVQHAGNILPRLYLLITVGASYIKSREAPACDILRDMTELCKGVQHPVRGLFLRFYLTQMCKDKLPDTGTEYELENGGTLNDAFSFLLTNFTESCRLWIRLQHQSTLRDKQKREKERYDLRVLVGGTLVRMAQLDGMNVAYYKEVALPRILEQIIGCKDKMAQTYLIDCIIQVFSDECHLNTLDQLLTACMQVQPGVDLKPILVNLLNRLGSFVENEPEGIPEGVDIFDTFKNHLSELMERQMNTEMASGREANNDKLNADLSSILELQVAFLSLILLLYPNRYEYIDTIMGVTLNIVERYLLFMRKNNSGNSLLNNEKSSPLLTKNNVNNNDHKDSNYYYLSGTAVDSIVELLSSPLKTLSLSVLQIHHFPALMKYLDFHTRKQVAVSMVDAVLNMNNPLNDAANLCRFFEFIKPLIVDEKDTPLDDDEDKDAFVSEQNAVCKIIHLISHDDIDIHFQMYVEARKIFGEGGPRRMEYTLPPLILGALKLATRLQDRISEKEKKREMGFNDDDLLSSSSSSSSADSNQSKDIKLPIVTMKKIFQFIHSTCTQLVQCNASLGIRYFMMAAIVADEVQTYADKGQYEAIIYEYITQTLLSYEDEINESRAQLNILIYLCTAIHMYTHNLDHENYDTVATKITQHSAKLLKKAHQCKAILACSHLFWNNLSHRDPRRVLECLQKCLKIADIAVQSSNSNVYLFIDILEKYLYYYEQQNNEITLDFIQNLVALCAEHLKFADLEPTNEASITFRNTVKYLKTHAQEGESRYHGLNIADIE